MEVNHICIRHYYIPKTHLHGGYYGLVVDTPPHPPPCPQTLHCQCDNLKDPIKIVSIFYMQIATCEDNMRWQQNGTNPIIERSLRMAPSAK